MKLNPFGKKTTTGYYDRIKAECAELAQQVEDTKAAADAAQSRYDATAKASNELERRNADRLYLSDAESRLRGERSEAQSRVDDLRHQLRDLEQKYRSLRAIVEAPADLENARQAILRLGQQEKLLQSELGKYRTLISKLEKRVADLESRIAQETASASQAMVEAEGEFVMPETLTRLDVEVRVARATLADVTRKAEALGVEVDLIPEQKREARRLFVGHQAKVAKIDLNEQLPNWLDVIARAAAAGHENIYSTSEREYLIEIPTEYIEAAKAKLAAEMPSA